ncbi:MAG: patatin-like phospholipase family protein [Oscillibacter sp.]|nr:patatin-like phospholipase family protein [Oscillibacter sp.]
MRKFSFDSLAFCGGGGKGAYQIGVWKALDELGCLTSIRAVSGTSIGGLNAALFALGDFRKAKQIWYSVRERDVFQWGGADEDGLFSRDGLRRILRSLPLRRLSDSPLNVYVGVFNVDTLSLEWRALNRLPEPQQIECLLATSALPLVYGRQAIGASQYLDGGIAFLSDGNVPIAPLYQNGYRNILLSSLDSDFSFGPRKNPLKGPNVPERYPDAQITPLQPLDHLGNLFSGTFNFTPSAIRNSMVSGYRDTMKQLNREDVFIMKNHFSKINIQIRNQMKRLFPTGAEIGEFIRVTNFSNINLRLPTMGGDVLFTDIVNIDGWRVQQHNLPLLKSHYRILDPDNVRVAWVLNPDDILQALDDYEAAQKFDAP